MTKRSVQTWFKQHTVETSISLLTLITLGAWTRLDMRVTRAETSTAAVATDIRDNYATIEYVDRALSSELQSLGEKLAELRVSMNGSNSLIASRLQDIGDRLAKIEGKLEGPGGTRP